MAVTIVQEGKANFGTAVSSHLFTLSTDMGLAATTAGNALIVGVACVTKTRTISSITDSASNTGWVKIDGGGSSSAGDLEFWWNPSPAASITTFTVNASGTSKFQVFLMEVSGLAGTINAHHSTQHTTASTTQSDSVTTTGAGSTWILAGNSAGTAATSVSSPFTFDTSISGGGAGLNIVGAESTQTAAGTYTCTFTQASQVATTVIAAFDVAAGGTVNGTLSNTTSAPGAIAGTVVNHQVQGTLSSPVAAPGAITGTATAHRIQGTLAGPTAAPGALAGSASTHTAHGTLSGPTAAPGAIAGTATNHRIQGSMAGPTGSAGAMTGTVTRHVVQGTLSSAVATPGLLAGSVPGGRSAYRRRPRPSVQ